MDGERERRRCGAVPYRTIGFDGVEDVGAEGDHGRRWRSCSSSSTPASMSFSSEWVFRLWRD
jgi:hypothetical protein